MHFGLMSCVGEGEMGLYRPVDVPCSWRGRNVAIRFSASRPEKQAGLIRSRLLAAT